MTDSAVTTSSFTISIPQPVADPAISPNGGTFTTAQLVTLSSTTAGATLYYTVDGSTPSSASNLYAAPFSVNTSTTVKAIAVKSGMTDSAVVTAPFTINYTTGGATVTIQ